MVGPVGGLARHVRSLLAVEEARLVPSVERSRTQEARIAVDDWVRRAPVAAGFLVSAATVLTAAAVDSLSDPSWPIRVAFGVAGAAAGAVLAVALLFLLFVVRAPSRQLRAAREQIASSDRRAREHSDRQPQLAFGDPIIPEATQPISVFDPNGKHILLPERGVVIRIPVVNALGAGEATAVHARLRFMPADLVRSHAPKHDVQAEWPDGHGGKTLEVTLPGNGRPREFDLVVVMEHYPHAYAWTDHSRAAGLAHHAVQATTFDVAVMVAGLGSGQAPVSLQGVLTVAFDSGRMIRAGWQNQRDDGATTWISWPFD